MPTEGTASTQLAETAPLILDPSVVPEDEGMADR